MRGTFDDEIKGAIKGSKAVPKPPKRPKNAMAAAEDAMDGGVDDDQEDENGQRVKPKGKFPAKGFKKGGK